MSTLESWKQQLVKSMFPVELSAAHVEEAFQLKSSHMPTSLYKYCPFSDYARKNFERDVVWFSKPDDFNDPYDCALSVLDPVGVSQEFNRKMMTKMVRYIEENTTERLIKITDIEMERITNSTAPYKELAVILYAQSPEPGFESAEQFGEIISGASAYAFGKSAEHLLGQMRSQFYVSCFSEVNDSVVMWSHYGDYHRGFCVEYDFASLGPGDPLNRMLNPVVYCDELLDMEPLYGLMFDGRMAELNGVFLMYGAIRKSKQWKYEREWRLVHNLGMIMGENKIPREWSVPSPKAVYLGAKASNEDQAYIFAIAGQKGIPVYQMKLASDHYAMISERIRLGRH